MPTPGWLRQTDLPVDAGGRRYIDPPNLDQILDQHVNWRGDVNAGGYKLLNFSFAAAGNIEVGGGGIPGNHSAYIDLIGDETYTDYGLRIIRNNTGPNASSELLHRGTGDLRFSTVESAPISFFVGATEAMRLTASGIRFPDGTIQGSAGVPTSRQIIAGSGLTGGGDLSANRTLSVVENSTIQRLGMMVNGVGINNRWRLNLIAGANVVISGADDAANDRVNITINSTGGGGGGSQTPWLSDIDAAAFSLNNLRNLIIRSDGFYVRPADAGYDWYNGQFTHGTGEWQLVRRRISDGNWTAPFTIRPDGNVGIGTANPGATLDVANLLSTDTPGNGHLLRFTYGTSALFGWRVDFANQRLILDRNWSGWAGNCLVVDRSNGNVGIGAASPQGSLHVYGAHDHPRIRVEGTTGFPRLELKSDSRLYQLSCGGSGAGPLAGSFYIFDENAGTTRLVVNTSGNVGIGRSAPNARLDVLYPSSDPGPVTGGGATAFSIRSADSTNANGLFMGVHDAATPYAWIQAVTPGISMRSLVLQPQGGAVGIGPVTNPTYPLEVRRGAVVGDSSFPSGNYAAAIFNVADAAGENGLVVANRYAAPTSTVFTVGSLYNTGGGPGFDSFLTVDGIGRVGIGVVNPAVRLHVFGGADNADIAVFSGANAAQFLGIQSNPTYGHIFHWNGSGWGNVCVCRDGGNVGIGVLPGAAQRLDVAMSHDQEVRFTAGSGATGGRLRILPWLASISSAYIESISPDGSVLKPFRILTSLFDLRTSAFYMPDLPSTNPGAGTKRFWYDPADGNRVKFAA